MIDQLTTHQHQDLDLPDREIAEAYECAAEQNVLAAINNDVFLGYWSVCADGQDFGSGNTYPSLDGHQMTDALLWLGQVEVVKANWDYVRSFQRSNGHLPIAILPGLTEVEGTPVEPSGGFYKHWVGGDPLRALGSTTYIQNADAIFRHTQDKNWLDSQLPSINLAADFLASLVAPEGHVGGAGYYVERPSRIEYDGVTQCHTVDAFRRVSSVNRHAGNTKAAQWYQDLAERVAAQFRSKFWVGDHFAEYIHPERGVITNHGLTDVDWSALATDVASPEQQAILWPQLKDEMRFYYGGMPTGIATRPETYEDWEFYRSDRHDLAAMGRVWYVECWARPRMGDADGILESIRRVCRVGRENDYYWRERYHPDGKGGYIGAGARKYCEYPANLIRIVQRFLMGVEFRLDGGVVLAPTVPETFWLPGFGQMLRWRNQALTYHMQRGRVTGSFCGNEVQSLYLGLQRRTDATGVEVSVNGNPVNLLREEDLIVIKLPSESTFKVEIVNAGAEL